MWIIKQNNKDKAYIFSVDDDGYEMLTYDRDAAKRFSSKQEAKDFMEEYYVTGSIIPA